MVRVWWHYHRRIDNVIDRVVMFACMNKYVNNGGNEMVTNVVTLKQYADEHGLDVKRLRRLARKNEFPGDVKPFKFGSVWAIDTDAPAIVLPLKSTRGARRADGRKRHIVYANAIELDAIKNMVGDDNVVDPRVAAKLRRAQRAIDAENIVENEHVLDIIDAAHEFAADLENDDNG